MTTDSVRIAFPGGSRHLRLCRTAAVSLGADLGLDVDELDDLRLAVGEAIAWLRSGVADDDEIIVGLAVVDDGVEVEGLAPTSSGDGQIDDLIEAILGATVDHHELTAADGERRIRLRKTRSAEPVR